ncbi:MAG TPA: type II toxin-antitoxin system MqsR family toxin [Polyangia bacterium]|jgi:hypothetical protein
MTSWLPSVLKRLRALAAAQDVWFTLKARREMALLGLDELDALEVLTGLTQKDSAGRLRSEHSGEWLFVFTPTLGKLALYVKVALRTSCIVVSFHEEAGRDIDEED